MPFGLGLLAGVVSDSYHMVYTMPNELFAGFVTGNGKVIFCRISNSNGFILLNSFFKRYGCFRTDVLEGIGFEL